MQVICMNNVHHMPYYLILFLSPAALQRITELWKESRQTRASSQSNEMQSTDV